MIKRIPKNNNRLWKYRTIMGYKQKTVAKILGLQPGTISKWELEKVYPSLKNALKLSILYDQPLEELYIDLTRKFTDEIQERKKSLNDIK